MEHTVKQGDSVMSVAFHYGHYWETIWNHPNNSELKALRKNPNILYPGDTLFIPEKRQKQVDAPVDALHQFKVKSVPAKLKVRFLKRGEPRANLPYALEIDGERSEGNTDGAGWIIKTIKPDAKQAKVDFGGGEVFEMKLGHLDPIDTLSGLQARLANLGIWEGAVDGQMTDEFRAALKAYQKKRGLAESGDGDAPTQQKVEEEYGS
ncbi:MAG: peptidoglycan-binding protein [Bryobacteraceae bacterium]|nr:peptidoglycan-binding protein [Bryobacteraceae bacterium]